LWESRLPELFSKKYDFFVGKTTYLRNIQLSAWEAVIGAHVALDSVFLFERQLSLKYADGKKYGYELRGTKTVKVYSKEFSKDYHKKLKGQVERQMRAAVKMIGDVWYSCWVNAGQPNLNDLLSTKEVVSDR